MKYLIIILLCFSALSKQREKEVLLGALTYHYFDFSGKADRFKHKVGDSGKLIFNEMVGYSYSKINGRKIVSDNYMLFNDSIGSPSMGYFRGFKKKSRYGKYETGFFVGTYVIQNDKWEKKKVDFSYKLKLGRHIAVIPVVGLSASRVFKFKNGYFFKLHNNFTPFIYNFTVGFGKKF